MAQITDRTTFFDFWRDEIASRCNAINSFVEFENDKAMDAFKSGQDTPALVMFDPEFFPVDQRSDNFQRRIQFGFYVVKKATMHEDQDEIATLKNDCLIITQDIIARLNKLNETKEFFGRFWSDKGDYKAIGRVFDNHYGCQYFAEFTTFKSIKHDASKWT